jgi:protease I
VALADAVEGRTVERIACLFDICHAQRSEVSNRHDREVLGSHRPRADRGHSGAGCTGDGEIAYTRVLVALRDSGDTGGIGLEYNPTPTTLESLAGLDALRAVPRGKTAARDRVCRALWSPSRRGVVCPQANLEPPSSVHVTPLHAPSRLHHRLTMAQLTTWRTMSLEGKKVLLVTADKVDEREFIYPYFRLLEEGAEVTVAGMDDAATVTGNKGMQGLPVDRSIEELAAADFDGLVIPGGFAPDRMRQSEHLLGVVRDFDSADKPIAFICHAGWVPVSAGILQGRTATSVATIKPDLVNAGATWLDEEVVIDRNLISSRTPDDLGPFMQAIIAALGD